MSELKSNLELLPRGEFLITKKDEQKIKGRFSMYVLDRFCESRSIANYISLLERIGVGMSIGDYADLVLMAFEDYHRANPSGLGLTKPDVMDLLDEQLDGLGGPDFLKLIKHAIGRVADVKQAEEAANKLTAEEEAQKKSESNQGLSGTPSDSGPTSAG